MKCEQCKWWHRNPQEVLVQNLEGPQTRVTLSNPQTCGLCRINPPSNTETKWPITHENDFCGGFKQKET
jgi:hypothetical protein